MMPPGTIRPDVFIKVRFQSSVRLMDRYKDETGPNNLGRMTAVVSPPFTHHVAARQDVLRRREEN
jgi:hypothetical protein